MVCMCATMFRIDMLHLAWCLDNLVRETPVNWIKVAPETAAWARRALRRMLEVN
jgi:quinolinate synthase